MSSYFGGGRSRIGFGSLVVDNNGVISYKTEVPSIKQY